MEFHAINNKPLRERQQSKAKRQPYRHSNAPCKKLPTAGPPAGEGGEQRGQLLYGIYATKTERGGVMGSVTGAVRRAAAQPHQPPMYHPDTLHHRTLLRGL